MTKKEIIKILEEKEVNFDPDASKAKLEGLLPVPDVRTAEKGKAPAGLTAVPGSILRKIDKDELLSLEKEGKLVKYDPRTGMGVVLTKGKDTKWPVD